jgi:PAS domain S-box-containing protein
MTPLQQELKLLVVEDNPGDFVLIEEYLAEIMDAVDIHHAKTFSEAKSALLQQTGFSAILLDLTLPDISGAPLVEKVIGLAGQIPLIVLTGYENQEFGLKTLSMGVTDYVLKDEITPFILGKVVSYGIERNRIRHSLQKSEKKYRDIFNLSPQPMFLIDVQSRIIKDINEAVVQQYGYTKDELIGLHLKDIRPEEEVSYFETEIDEIDQNQSQFYHTTVKHQRKNGEVFNVELSTSDITLDGKPMRMALAEDVSDKIEAELNIRNKTKLLRANAKVTSALIKNEDWLQALNETLNTVGDAVNADRVYFFENYRDPATNKLFTSQILEWSAKSVESQLTNDELGDLDLEKFPEIFSVLKQKEVYQRLVKDIPESDFKDILESQDIVSILHFPIFIGDEFYGFIGFDDCKRERIWDQEEIQYLETLGSNIASAIKLRNTTEELKANEYKFKSMVEEGGDLIEILDENGNFKFLSPNLKKILGWETEDLLYKNAFDFIHPDDRKKAKQEFNQLREKPYIELAPFRFKNKKSGKYDWLKCSATNLQDDAIINGLLITASVITEQKYFNELQKLERDVLEKNTLSNISVRNIIYEFLVGIEDLHSGIRTSVTLIVDSKLENFCSPSLPEAFLDTIEGIEVGENKGSCGTAAFRKEQVHSVNIFEDPLWEDYAWLGEKYGFSACWSVPIMNANGDVFATFAVYYDEPSNPSEYENNTVERAAHILRILFESEEKVKAEKELSLREKRFKALVQEGSDLIGILDENFRFSYVSPSVGDQHESYLGLKAFHLVHPEDIDRVKESFQKLSEEKRIIIPPYRLRDHTGNYYWVETIITNLLDEPAVKGYVASSRNVTHQIKREQKLSELSLVASKTTDIVVITDSNGLITWVNQAFNELTGYTLGEAMGKKPGSFLQGPETDPETIDRISEAINNYRSIEETILNYNKSGSSYWLNMSIDPIFDDDGNCTHFIAIERNVTEKIERTKKLQESLERYDIVSKATSDTIWDLDLKSDEIVYNNNIHNMFGYKIKEVKSASSWWRNKIHIEDLPMIQQTLDNVINDGTERFQMEYRFMDAQGDYKYISDRAFIIKDENDNAIRIIGAMQDITHEVEEEQQLKLLESVVTNTSESVVVLNAEPGEFGREIIYVNQAFTEHTGYEEEEVLGKTLHFLNGPKTDEMVRAELREAMDKYQPIEVEFINYKKDGNTFWINTSMVPVQNKRGDYTHWVAIGRDITVQKGTEEEIKSSLHEKETLLAEIHHRVKNNLAVVSGMMQLQAFESENTDLKNKLYDSVVRIKTMATVHELLYQSNSFSQLEFSDTLTKLAKNISETLQPDNQISLKIHCESLKLNINQAIPASLIVNEVLTNAYKHAFRDSKKGEIDFHLAETNGAIKIRIKDNGIGFPDEDLKNSGSLGMHLINVLTDQLGGDHSYKNVEKGTVFTLNFDRQEIKKGIGNANLN